MAYCYGLWWTGRSVGRSVSSVGRGPFLSTRTQDIVTTVAASHFLSLSQIYLSQPAPHGTSRKKYMLPKAATSTTVDAAAAPEEAATPETGKYRSTAHPIVLGLRTHPGVCIATGSTTGWLPRA